MSEPQIEQSLQLRNSYVACIRKLEAEARMIDAALSLLRERLVQHERKHGFTEPSTDT